MSIELKELKDEVKQINFIDDDKDMDSLSDEMSQVGFDTKVQEEVRAVLDHTEDKNSCFRFKLKFKKDTLWVDESNCDCEYLIREYLHATNPQLKMVYGFCRVSTKGQASALSISLDMQEAKILAQGRMMHRRVKMYKISESAYENIPKRFQEICDVAKQGDTIIVYRIDRLSRNIVGYFSLLEDLEKRGVHIYSQDENLWYSTDKLAFIQKILTANVESENLSKKMKRCIEFRKQRGDECLGGVKYGKMIVREKGGRIIVNPNPREIKVIKRIKRSPEHPKDIADMLNEEGLLKRGRKWTQGMIMTIKNGNF